MTQKLIILLFCFFFKTAWSNDTIVSFHNSKVAIPKGFKELSKEELIFFKATVFDRPIMTVYEKKDDVNGTQRLIFYYDSLKKTKNIPFKNIVELKREIIKESGASFTKVEVDEKHHCAYGIVTLFGKVAVFGFSVDENGMMGIQYNCSKGIQPTDKTDFKQLITSIKHHSPYHFVPEENPKAKEAKKEMKDYGVKLTFALIAMIAIWLFRKYVLNNNQA